MNTPCNLHSNNIEALDLLDPQLGIEHRRAVLDRVLADAATARQLRLAFALDASADQLASELRRTPVTHTRWVRLGLPMAAAALMLLVSPQQRQFGQKHQAIASIQSSATDELLSGSFEAGSDVHFGGGFE